MMPEGGAMRVDAFEFGKVTIDGVEYEHDVVIECGKKVRKRKKAPSKDRRGKFGHTPLTPAEDIPWDAVRLWIGTGAYGSLPVPEDFHAEARQRGVDMRLETTPEIVERLKRRIPKGTNVILHVTC